MSYCIVFVVIWGALCTISRKKPMQQIHTKIIIQFVCNSHCLCKMFSWIFQVKIQYQKINKALKTWKIELTCARWAPKWLSQPRTWHLSNHRGFERPVSQASFATGSALCWSLLMFPSQTHRAGWMHHWSHISITEACEMLKC